MTAAAKILFVDDEKQMLTALNRVFRAKTYTVFTANSGQEALNILETETMDVIVSDMRMPEMDGASFLAKTVDLNPNSRRILLTGYSDQESTVRAINEGQVHQYILKPWDNEALKQTIDSEIEEKERIRKDTPDANDHEMLQEQVVNVSTELSNAHMFADMAKEELLKQYNTTIKVISNLINLQTPTPLCMNTNVVTHSVAMSKLIKLNRKVITEVRNAAQLFQVGKLAVDNDVIDIKINKMSEAQLSAYNKHAVKGADLLLPLSSLDYAANLIRHQNENVDGSGYPDNQKGKAIPLGSRILRVVVDYQQIVHGLYFDDAYSPNDALDFMAKSSGKKYDATILMLYGKFIAELSKTEGIQQDRLLKISDLKAGMNVSRDLVTNEGLLLITKGTRLNELTIRKLDELQARDTQQLNVFIKEQGATKLNPVANNKDKPEPLTDLNVM
jgi:response regulator RpfG family c-di-GMP phosphodiesterase